jgi:GWxTD domain-containing protein
MFHRSYPHFLSLLAVVALWVRLATSAPGQRPEAASFLFPEDTPFDSIRTEDQYFKALRSAQDSVFRWQYEYPFLLLLNDEQKQAYLNLASQEERKAFIEFYWKASNPNPLLAENDWLMEFIRRFRFVREHFATTTPPYFDDRGRYYIKYGKPVVRYEDPGGPRWVAFWGRNNPRASYTVVPNETWSYQNISPDFIVHFMRRGKTFQEIPSLREVIVERGRQLLAWRWSDLVKSRAPVSPTLGQAAMRIQEVESAVLHARLSRRKGLLRGQVETPHERLYKIAKENEDRVARATSEAPPAAHDPIKAMNRVRFQDVIAQFRGPNGTTRVEIAFLAPLKKNLVKRLDQVLADTLAIEYASLLRDQNYDPVISKREVRQVPLGLTVTEDLPNAVGYLSFLSSPGEAELTLQVRDLRRDRMGFRRQPLSIRDFNGGDLTMSDIMLFSEVMDEDQERILPLVERESLKLSPYPYSKVKKSLPLFCYFEVYNVGSTDAYEVEYKIESLQGGVGLVKKLARWITGPPEGSVRVRYDRPVSGDATQELISVDLRNVPNDTYRLEVTVTSKEDRSAKAFASRRIEVVN